MHKEFFAIVRRRAGNGKISIRKRSDFAYRSVGLKPPPERKKACLYKRRGGVTVFGACIRITMYVGRAVVCTYTSVSERQLKEKSFITTTPVSENIYSVAAERGTDERGGKLREKPKMSSSPCLFVCIYK